MHAALLSDDERLQADYLRDVMTMAFSHPAMQAIVMWGFWEGRHWKPDAALYRKDWSTKPAGKVWEELVLAAEGWRETWASFSLRARSRSKRGSWRQVSR